MYKVNENELINALEQSKQSRTFAAKRLAPFFEIEVSLRIFGVEIFHWKFPPEKKSDLVSDANSENSKRHTM